MTIIKKIERGLIESERGDEAYNPTHLIPAIEVEKMRAAQFTKFSRKLESVSTPVPAEFMTPDEVVDVGDLYEVA